jgi:acetyl esterase/lipase
MSRRDPEINAFKQQLKQLTAAREGVSPSIDAQRQSFDAQHGAVLPAEDCEIAAFRSGQVRGERITPKGADKRKALIYHHGGGHMFGSPLSHRHLVSRLAKAAGVVAFNMEYRLAPEHPYPSALEDALAAYRYVSSEGFKPRNVVLGGESAGGNLTAALLLKLRAEHLEHPAGAYLLSPWLDLTQSGESYEARAPHDPMLTRAALERCSEAYRAGVSGDDPFVSPLMADLTGLPALFIQVGADEVLLSDSLDFTRRAALAGVEVQLQVWPEMVHAWPLFHPALPTAGLGAITEAGAWIARQLAH